MTRAEVLERRRRRMIMALALWLVAAIAGSSAADEDETRRLLGALGLEVPVRPLAASLFALPGLDGTKVSLADLQGRVVMLYFWTTW